MRHDRERLPAGRDTAPLAPGTLRRQGGRAGAHPLPVGGGLSNAEIAAELFVVGLRDRVQAVVTAYESGLLRAGGGS
jgi:hypothetical protein